MLRPDQPGDESSSSLESSVSCSPGDETPGCPETSLLQLRLIRVFEFPRILHPSALPSGGSSSYPESRVLPVTSAMRLRVAPNPASPGCASGEFPGRPESSLPWLLRPMDHRASSNLAPSGYTVYAYPSYPESCILRRHQWRNSGLPQSFNPFATPTTHLELPRTCIYG